MPTTQTDGLRHPIVVKAVFPQDSMRTQGHHKALDP